MEGILEGREKLEKMVEWTKLKMRIHANEERIIYFNEREIWWASIGINIGNEIDGKNGYFERPVLVLKKINPNTLLVIPITTQDKRGYYYLELENEAGKDIFILSQMRLISSKRLIRKMKNRTVSEKNFLLIKEKVAEILNIKAKPTILAE
ncbi:MAG TPA: type II toxin-antitoxin system PemK/MazF family toxin [Candidatus Nanoarchaeia archaeon]|nr:type II toxin-antitoxin system PemK/MazF family toxin [Candidatus Nanoarchaeia archaeon]